jgi:hypothetical protein
MFYARFLAIREWATDHAQVLALIFLTWTRSELNSVKNIIRMSGETSTRKPLNRTRSASVRKHTGIYLIPQRDSFVQ